MKLYFDNLDKAATILGQGMLGIMVVMGIIILTTMLLNKLASKKKKED